MHTFGIYKKVYVIQFFEKSLSCQYTASYTYVCFVEYLSIVSHFILSTMRNKIETMENMKYD